MSKKECIAMLLAGGTGQPIEGHSPQESLSRRLAFGGKFRIIDFSLSNCSNSGSTRWRVLTQYRSSPAAPTMWAPAGVG